MRIRPAAILALLPAFTATLVAGECPIVLDRPEHLGAQATLSASCRSQQHRSIQFDLQAPQAQNVDYGIAFAGEREVQAVSAQGQATALRLIVTRLERTVSGRPPFAMLPAGAQVVTSCVGGHAQFRDGDGKELPDPVQQSLRMVLVLGDGTPLQDAAFGSSTPRAPGEQWAINAVPAARVLADLLLIVDPAKLSGSVTFRELVTGSDRQQQRITAALAFSDFTVPALAPSMTVTRSAGTLTVDRLYPLDPRLPMASEQRLLKESLAAQGKTMVNGNERQLSISIEVEQSNEILVTPHDPVGH